jgi:hypothetical protein
MRSSHEMLTGFRDALRESSFPGSYARHIALGMDFIERMIQQSRMNMDMAKREEKEMIKRTKDAIKEAGGQINGEPVATPNTAS